MLKRHHPAEVPSIEQLWLNFCNVDTAIQRQANVLGPCPLTPDELERLREDLAYSYILRMIAATEGSVRLEFAQRRRKRKKEPWKCWHGLPEKTRLDEILRLWSQSKAAIASRPLTRALHRYQELRGARHWLAHGQHWPLRLGSSWDVVEVLEVCRQLVRALEDCNAP